MLRTREVSAREVVVAHLERVDRANPAVNAIVTRVDERALDRAAAADDAIGRGADIGPLHGLPVAHKDLALTSGIRTTFGSPIYRDFIPTEDSAIVERIRAAGAITVGKTNTPEFGAGSQTFNPVFGATRNPHDLTKSCGGSSGGAAVALACGMVAIADGSDMGGSLRNPASFCGVVGLRPSVGRVPSAPSRLPWRPQPGGPASMLSVDGPMARTVADVALFLRAIADPDPRFGEPLDRDFAGVRIGWWKDLGGVPVDRRVRAVVDAQRPAFESLGCRVDEAEPDFRDADEIFKTLRAHAFVTGVGRIASQHRGLVKDTILWEIDRGARLTAADIEQAQQKHRELHDRMRRFMETYEFFVLPTVQVPPFDLEQPYVTEIDGVRMETYIDWMKSCYYISITGQPAISVPAGFTEDGLPIGIQIVGRSQDDWGILQLAHAFECARGPRRTFPCGTGVNG